jgi:hypothetical protein
MYVLILFSQLAQAKTGQYGVVLTLRGPSPCHGESGALLLSGNTLSQENPLVIGSGGSGLAAKLGTAIGRGQTGDPNEADIDRRRVGAC